MNCNKCGAELSGMWLEAPGVASAFCACGNRPYFFKLPDGSWETQAERQARMARVRICEDCGDEFTVGAAVRIQGNVDHFCLKCKSKRQYDGNLRRASNGGRKAGSPWGIGTRRAL